MSKNKPKHQSNHPTANPNQQGGQQGSGPNNILVRGEIQVGRDPSLTKEHETERKADTAQGRKKFVVEKLTLVVVAVYAGVTIWQASLTRTAIADAREHFVKDQAPYIWVTPQPPVVNLNEQFRWDVHYSNYGRSPALNVRRCVNAAYGARGFSYLSTLPQPSFSAKECTDAQDSPVASVSVVPPGFPSFSTSLSKDRLTQTDIDTIKATEAGAFVWGIIAYDDSSGHSYEAIFCSFRFISGAISDCPKYNFIRQTK
jgi:hypothetical protein